MKRLAGQSLDLNSLTHVRSFLAVAVGQDILIWLNMPFTSQFRMLSLNHRQPSQWVHFLSPLSHREKQIGCFTVYGQ